MSGATGWVEALFFNEGFIARCICGWESKPMEHRVAAAALANHNLTCKEARKQ